jgi:hypothetical protein
MPVRRRAALDKAGAFDELRTFWGTVDLAAIEQAHAMLVHRIQGPNVVPSREVAVAASGKLVTRDMDVTRREALFKAPFAHSGDASSGYRQDA